MNTEFLQDYDLDRLKQFIEEHMESCKYIIEAGWSSGKQKNLKKNNINCIQKF